MVNKVFTKAEIKQMDIERRLAVVDILRTHTDKYHPILLSEAAVMCNGLTNVQELRSNSNRFGNGEKGKHEMQTAFHTVRAQKIRHFAELDDKGQIIARYDRIQKCTLFYAE